MLIELNVQIVSYISLWQLAKQNKPSDSHEIDDNGKFYQTMSWLSDGFSDFANCIKLIYGTIQTFSSINILIHWTTVLI